MSLISVTPKLDAFTKFCSEQDPVREINHKDGWDFCAIGEFTPEYNAQFPSDNGSVQPYWVGICIETELESVSGELGEHFINTLGNGREYSELETYGGLTEWLHQMQHQAHEAAQ